MWLYPKRVSSTDYSSLCRISFHKQTHRTSTSTFRIITPIMTVVTFAEDYSLGSPSRHSLNSTIHDEDLSVISRGSESPSSGNHDYILCASPSSSDGSKKTKQLHQSAKSPNKLYPSNRKTRSAVKTSVLQRCYGNADFSDRIGRTLSFLLVARLALSFLLATILDGE